MLKRLLFTSLYLLFFVPVFAQTNTDSTKHSPVDTTTKHPVIDTSKHLPADSAKHTTAKKIAKDSPNEVVFQHSPIKGLSDTRYNAYLRGDDLDSMALTGQLNHYP